MLFCGTSKSFSGCSWTTPRVDSALIMRRVPGLLSIISTVLSVAVFLSCTPLTAQRRPNPMPFPDDDAGLSPSRGRSFTVSGVVSDAESHQRIDGARVDLQGLSGGILATEFTSSSGSFEFTNVSMGSYQLIFEQVGYQDSRQQLEIEGPVFGMSVALRRLISAGTPGAPRVSVRDLSIPHQPRPPIPNPTAPPHQNSP